MTKKLEEIVESTVREHFDSLGRILEEPNDVISSAVRQAIPALLNVLTQKGSTDPGGAELSAWLADCDGSFLDDLHARLADGRHTQLMNRGHGLLDRMLGDTRPAIVDSLAKTTGGNQWKSDSLLSLVAPIVVGVLAKDRGTALDSSDRSDPTGSQEVLAPLPFHEENVLTASDLSAGISSPNEAVPGNAGGGLFMALLPLVLLGALAIWAWRYVIPNGTETNGSPNQSLSLPAINLPAFPSQEIGIRFGELAQSLADVKNAEDAGAVVPQVDEAVAFLDQLDLQAISAGPEHAAVRELFDKVAKRLHESIDQANANPDIESVLKPSMDELFRRFLLPSD